MARTRSSAAGVVLLCLLSSALCAQEATPEVLRDEWHAIYLQDGKIGHQHVRVEELVQDGESAFRTRAHQEIVLKRGAVTVSMAIDSMVLEDSEGRLMAFGHRLSQAGMGILNRGRVEDGEMEIRTVVGGNQTTTRAAAPAGLCPWGLERLIMGDGLEPGATHQADVFLPEFPTRSVAVTVRVDEKRPVRLYEVQKELYEITTEVEVLPGMPTVAYVDEEGITWLTRASLAPGLELEFRRTTDDLATAPDDPPEILIATIIPTDRPIPDARNLALLEAAIDPVDELPTELALPADALQHVEREGQALRVTVRKASADEEAAYELPYGGQEHRDLLRPNGWLEIHDPKVAAMAEEAVGQEKNALRAARRIEAYVEQAIGVKDLSVGMATAAETAANRVGDCTEHAVLTAALCRAAGMPSRVVGGLAYADLPGPGKAGFYYHMWAEAYVGEWIPLDAALGGHDATHIVLDRTDLARPGDMLSLSAAISRFLGKVRVRVIRAEGQGGGAAATPA